MTDGSKFCNVGVSYPLAAEIGRQMTTRVGNAVLLCALGLNAEPAIELARQINAGHFSDVLLTSAMWNPVTARAFMDADSGPPPTPPETEFRFGVSIAGADLTFPAWPTLDEMTYVRNRITNLHRITIGWAHCNEYQGPEGLQLTPFGPLNPDYLTQLKTVMDNATALGIEVLLDLHNFGGGPGLSGQITIVSITSSGTLATAMYSAVGGAPLVNGATVDIEGVGPSPFPRGLSPYNGQHAIFNVTPTTFQYTMASDPGVTTAGPVLNPGPISAIVAAEQADIGSDRCPITAFVDLWSKLSIWLRANVAPGTVIAYEPMNEWAQPDLTVPFLASQAVTTALRALGDNTKLAFDGNHFSSGWDFLDNNNDNLRTIVDPANNYAIAPHGYADYDGSGRFMSYATNLATPGEAPAGLQTNPMILVQRAERQIGPWAIANGLEIWWGEFAVSNDSLLSGGNDNYQAWNAVLDNWLTYAQAKKWTVFWWGNGSEFGSTYPFQLSPSSATDPTAKDYSGFGVQPPQQVVIDRHLGYTGPQPVGYRVDNPTTVTRETVTIGLPSDPYTARYGGLIAADIHILPNVTYVDGRGNAGGSFGGVTFPAGENAVESFGYTPTNPGKQVVGATNDGPLRDVAGSAVVYSREAPDTTGPVTFPLVGVNLEGMEAANQLCIPIGVGPPLPGVYRKTDSNYYFYRGFNCARVCFSRSYIQQRLNGALDTTNTLLHTLTIYDENGNPNATTYSGLQALDCSVSDVTQSGLTCMLDLHDFSGSLITVDISSVSVSGTTATCTMTDTSILNNGATITLGANGATGSTAGLPVGVLTIVNSTTFTMPVPGGTPSSGATTGRFNANVGTAGYPISAYADFITKVASRYAGFSRVLIDLMNEPAGVSAATMHSASQAAITAARAAGYNGWFMYEGGGSFSNASSWISSGAADLFLTLNDPLNKTIAQVHSYVDSNFNGSSPTAGSAGSGAISLLSCTDHARAHGYKMFLGEFGMSTNPGLITEAGAQLDHISANADVWVGWTAWTTNPYALRPPEVNTPPFQYPPPGGSVTDQVQLQALMNHSFSSFYAAPPSGINMNWAGGFDDGFVSVATSVGTVLTNPMKGIIPNIDVQGVATFALVSNPGGTFSIDVSKRLVLQQTLTDHTSYPISISVTTARGLSATFSVTVKCESTTTFDPAQTGAFLTLSAGNMVVTHNASPATGENTSRLTKGRSGGPPVYFEFLPSGGETFNLTRIWASPDGTGGFSGAGGLIAYKFISSGAVFSQGSFFNPTPALSAWGTGNRIRVAWRPADKTIFFAVGAGNFNNNASANPTTNVGGYSYATAGSYVASNEPWYPGYAIFNANNSAQFFMTPTSWAFALPSGFGAL